MLTSSRLGIGYLVPEVPLASLNEGTSVAIMEAMAMEVLSVVTNVGGTPALVSDGIDGLLVEPKEPQMLADAIEMLLNDEN